MKRYVRLFLCALLAVGAVSRAQVPPPCTNFDDKSLDKWTTLNATAAIVDHGSGLAVDISDQSGASFFVAPASYNGNWSALSGGCGELCYDINIVSDGLSTSNPVSVAFEITDGTFRAMFKHNPVVEGSGWHTFCAPLGPLGGGNLPSNGQGSWTMLNGANADFPTLLQNVTSFKFDVDFSAGTLSEELQLDNVCFHAKSCPKADFTIPAACINQPVTVTNTSTGATSNNWTLTGGTPSSSTATSPTVTYAAAGTFPITLCINGGASCVTKNLTVSPPPPVPVISGPTGTCEKTATYCVTTPAAGVTYSWSIVPATAGSVAPATGSCTTVTWNSSAGGVLVVTATNAQGCKSSSRLQVTPCDTHNTCCPEPSFKVISATLPFISGSFVFEPVISTSTPVRRVTVDIISADIHYFGSSCGTSGPFPPTITQALPTTPATSLTPSQPIANSSEAIWFGSNSPLSAVTFPMKVVLPPHNPDCTDIVRLCVKYTVTDDKCRTCEIVQCYEFRRKGQP